MAAPAPARRKPVRVRKARLTTACPACGRLIIRGDTITSVNGGPFAHQQCPPQLGRTRPITDLPPL